MKHRRRFSRFLPDEASIQIVPENGLGVSARIVNESFGGLGVECDTISGLALDQNVDVVRDDVPYPAKIVVLRPQEDRTFYVGVQWTDTGMEDDDDEFDDVEADDDSDDELETK